MQFFRNLLKHVLPAKGNAYRPHLLRDHWLLFFLYAALAAEVFLVGNLILRQKAPGLFAAVISSEIITLTNEERAALGAPRLHAAAQLGSSAERKAQDMASRGYFAHSAPYGKDPWAWLREAGYEYRYAGENLAVRFVDSRDVIDAWMSSPSHRANITKAQYSEIGVGVAQGFYNGEPATYVVQYFGAPSAAADGGWSLPQDEGAAVVQSQPLTDSVLRQLVRIAAEPRESAALALGTVATALTLLVAAAFLHKIEFQPSPMLFSGALVAFIALALYGFNSALLAPGDTNSVETASALDSLRVRKVIIDKGISEIAPDFMRVYRFNI